MKVRAVANGNIVDLPEDHPLIAAGIYEPVAEEGAPEKKAAPEKQDEKGSTKVEPLTTQNMPQKVKKVK